MSVGSSGERFIAVCREVISNPYFWAGIGTLLLIGGLLYIAVDKVIMPNYTRYGTAIEVPDVRNSSVEEAQATLNELGFQVEEQEGQYNPNVPQDEVVDQSPAPSTPIKPNRRVYLTLNRGETPTVVLPDLGGTSRREARSRLEGRGLDVEVDPDSLPSPHEGTITRQSPAPGDTVDVGSLVSLWYSTGLGDEDTTIPNLVGLSVKNAREKLEEQQLRPILVHERDEEDDSDEGGEPTNTMTDVGNDEDEPDESELFVRDQDKAPDTEVPAGTEIRLYVTEDASAVPDPAEDASDNAAADSVDVSTSAASRSEERDLQTW
ncbi:MAG: PASTA domain-containing protein [Longimonas sp.]|uniref:PASTA domain-containing protein n=1 Tax=Longimonas sp. TaxID=2039626 RepID=UPI003976BA9D